MDIRRIVAIVPLLLLLGPMLPPVSPRPPVVPARAWCDPRPAPGSSPDAPPPPRRKMPQ